MIHDNFTIRSANHAARIWLMASYLYYLRSDLDSFISDSEFDNLTQLLIENYEDITKPTMFPNGGSNPPLSDLIKMEDLQAGTGFALREHDYPTITKHAAVAMAKDKFWTLKQEFIFVFPHVDRLVSRYDLDKSKVSDCFDRNAIVNKISYHEPALQDPERYYQGDRDSEFYDEEREHNGIILKDNEAEAFLNGILSIVDKDIKDGLVLGNIFYRDGVGWIAHVFDKCRSFNIKPLI